MISICFNFCLNMDMFRRIALLVVLADFCLVFARNSPNAAEVDDLFKNRISYVNNRYSDNVIEDAKLDVPGLIKKYRYPVEVHHVVTPDDYVLEMHRIPHGRDRNNLANVRRPAVLVMHGLIMSSADFVIMGPGSALGYILAEEGFDVWLGNARGNYYSRQNLYLNPDSILDKRFWKFTWDEIGRIDLPSMIDYVLNATNHEKLHYIGHSQGTTSFFVMGSLLPEYNDKIISMNAMAPVAFMTHNKNPFELALSLFADKAEIICDILSIKEFLPNTIVNQLAGEALCRDQAITQSLCSNILFLISGWDPTPLNTTMLPAIFGHTPGGSSARQFAHYGQLHSSKEFRRYDYGTNLANLKAYRSINPPKYDLSKVTAPVFLHYADNDSLAQVSDVDTLFKQLGGVIGKFRVQYNLFNHIDYVYGINAKELVYDKIINLIKAMEIYSV